jgi:hypothetical protein
MRDSANIAALNDQFRENPHIHGRLLMTAAVAAKGPLFVLKCGQAIRTAVFEKGNDPYSERDFETMVVDGETVWIKIDYYDKHDQNYGSEDQSDPAKTLRVGTILFPSDYSGPATAG